MLQTKLHIPKPPSNIVHRNDLIDKLQNGFRRKLILVSAPAGFGKSCLLSEWIDQTKVKACWYSINNRDNDRKEFVKYLVAAVQTAEKDLVVESLVNLDSPIPVNTEVILEDFLNELLFIEDELLIILDDFHIIHSEEVLHMMNFMLEHLPDKIHFVLATRSDPDLSIAKLRSQNQVLEIRASELSFSKQHINKFYNKIFKYNLSDSELNTLENKTEGWVAGLQLAAFSMQHKTDKSSFIREFASNNRYIMDYLIEEVLETLDDTVKIFLLKTSILNRMCFTLCDSITGSNNSFEMLNYLEKKNMFILPLDNERKWYRYHHLFAELLQRKLKSSFPEFLNDLHRQASEWFNENEYYDEAIHHLLVIKEHIRVAELVVKEASNIWSDGDHFKYQDWIDSIPAEIVDEIPHLLVLQAEVKMTLWEISKSEELLEKALKKLESFENNSKEPLIPITKEEIFGLKGRIKINFSQVASYHEKTNEIIPLVKDGLKLLDKDESTWRMVASISLGDAYYIQGDLNNACKAQCIVENSIKSKTNPFLNLVIGGNLSVSLRHMGKLNEASDNCAKLLKFAMDAGMTNTIVSGWIQCIFGELKTEVNDLNQAEVQLKSGISIAERYGAPGMLLMCYMYQLRLFFSTGKYDQIDQFVKRFEKDYSNQPVTNHLKNQISYWKLRVLSLKGEVEQIEVWLKGYENNFKNDFLYFEEPINLAASRVYVQQRKDNLAVQLLEKLISDAECYERNGTLLEALLLKAILYQQKDDNEIAKEYLNKALYIAETNGFIRTILDEGSLIERLIIDLKKDYKRNANKYLPLVSVEYLSRIIREFEIDSKRKEESETDLSRRELEVLKLLAQKMSNNEICEALFISLSTVKTHIGNILLKLEAKNRTEAIEIAKENALL